MIKKKVIRLFKEAVNLEDTDTMFNLGLCYKYSRGVEKDIKKAIEYCQKSADLGNCNAMCESGICYENEFGVTTDTKKLVELYWRAYDLNRICYILFGIVL
jgi:uncharacterized protein